MLGVITPAQQKLHLGANMASIKVVISGITGKMGLEAVAAVSRESNLEVVGGTC